MVNVLIVRRKYDLWEIFTTFARLKVNLRLNE